MELIADLHIHSKYSDGVLTPIEIIEKAKEERLSAISITDHDTVQAYVELQNSKESLDIELITGIELSCYEKNIEYHILGYFFDLYNSDLWEHIQIFRKARFDRAKQMVAKLNKLGIKIEFELVLEKAGFAPLSRPHIAMALVEQNLVPSFRDAFLLYLGDNAPAYIPKMNFPIKNAINLIKSANGISVLAHPTQSVTSEALYEMIEMGIDGIEIVHPLHDDNLQKHYKKIANQFWLLTTGGSDFHGIRDYDYNNFGRYVIPYSYITSMKRYVGRI